MGPVELIVFLTIWALPFGVLVGILMRNKGRSSCGGFALGFLLGPIGLVIAFLIKESPEHLYERIEAEEQVRQAMRQRQTDDIESDERIRIRIRCEEQIRAEERRRAEEELRRERDRGGE